MESRYILRHRFEEHLRRLLLQDAPPEAEVAEAARSFDTFARESLRASGWPPSVKTVCDVLGERTNEYYTVLNGSRVTPRRLLVWYAKWTITFTSGQQSVLPADLQAPQEQGGITEKKVPPVADVLNPSEVAATPRRAEVWVRLSSGEIFHGVAPEAQHE